MKPRHTFAGYQLIREIGEGASGVVFEARDPQVGRSVALKLLIGPLLSHVQIGRFRREREALAMVDHPHVLKVHASGSSEGQPYVVTELLPGRTLRDLMDRPLPLEQATEYALQIADGVAALHAKGLIHRDLKPANVLVDAAGRLKVADLGLAVSTDYKTLTETGTLVGTPLYMAPEALSGEQTRAPQVDVYSLGLLLFELLTNQHPHQGADSLVALFLQRRAKPAPDPRGVVREIPVAVAAVCRKAMAEEPTGRYATAAEFAQALRSSLDVAQTRRRFAPVGVAALAALVVLGALTLFALSPPARRSPPPSPPPPAPGKVPPVQRAEVPRPAPTRIELEHTLSVDPSVREYESSVAWGAGGIYSLQPDPPQVRRHALDLSVAERVPFVPLGSSAPEVAWDLQRGYVAANYRRGRIRWTSLSGGGSGELEVPGGVSALCWRPDRLALVVASRQGDVYEISPPSSELVELTKSQGSISCMAPLADGSFVGYAYTSMLGSNDDTLSSRFCRLGSAIVTAEPLLQFKAVRVVSAGETIVAGTIGHQVFERAPDELEPVSVYRRDGARSRPLDIPQGVLPWQNVEPAHDGPVTGLSLSRDGRLLASVAEVGDGGELHLWQRPQSTLLVREVLRARPLGVAFSPDADRVCVVFPGGGLRLFRLR